MITMTTTAMPAVTGVSDDGVMGPRADRPRRRTFTAEYKNAVLAEYEALTEPGARGALLRREGLYSSHLVEWRRARDAGGLSALRRVGGPAKKSPEQAEIEKLRAENAKVTAELAKTKTALEIVGKAHALLELLSESAPEDDRGPRPRRSSPRSRT